MALGDSNHLAWVIGERIDGPLPAVLEDALVPVPDAAGFLAMTWDERREAIDALTRRGMRSTAAKLNDALTRHLVAKHDGEDAARALDHEHAERERALNDRDADLEARAYARADRRLLDL
jgi:hypothetical protein